MVWNLAPQTIALVGGTGNQGPPLAVRWALAGNRVLIGSRRLEKARRVAGGLEETLRRLGCEVEVGFGVKDQARDPRHLPHRPHRVQGKGDKADPP